jgi:hypothetical protein
MLRCTILFQANSFAACSTNGEFLSMTATSSEFISIDELRRRLKGNGLIAENEGVFHADHILIKAEDDGALTVCAVAKQEADGNKTVARLQTVLAGVGNVRVHSIPNALRAG